jgi:para-nitrobenzyl esterase
MSKKENATITTKSGKIKGSYQQGLYVFKGIPYAAPPVGKLRWLPPQPTKPWNGVRQAKDFEKIAPQNVGLLDSILPELSAKEPQGEDCLYLNIWSPGLDDKRRPVLFWIHGGAFTIGSSSSPVYNGNTLAARGDVVVVTINYRLGMLGFLNLNEVTKGGIPATGNEGLLDQIAALEWVRDNISTFGGDPNNITVFGESAGAMSIGCLLAMPKARGLFSKAILQSGAPNTAIPLEPSVKVAEEFLGILGLKGTETEALRALSVERLLSVQEELRAKRKRLTAVAPVIDGKMIPKRPIDSINSGSAAKIPLLGGTNLEEWKLFNIMEPDLQKLDDAGLVNTLQQFVPAEYGEYLIETYRKARTGRELSTSPLELFSAIQTDLMFRVPAIRVVEAQFKNHQSAYNYLFTWKSPIMGGLLGACHVLEIGFVFGNLDEKFCGGGPLADKLSTRMQDAWLSFARTGNPSCESLGSWPQYGENRKTMILGKECNIEEAPYEEERHIWDIIGDVYPK